MIKPRIASKLVRDNIPGQRIAEPREHYNFLIAKLHEEVEEVARCRDNSELTEELADVIEVVLAITRVRNIHFDDVHAVRLQKLHGKGGFMKGVIQDGE